jgi:hypothetical protein
MKSAVITRLGGIGAALIIAAACGGSAPEQAGSTPTPTPTTSPQTPADVAAQFAQGMQQLAQNQQTAKPVEFEQLIALLPEPEGWTRSKPRGTEISVGVSASRAEARYEQGESTINLEITDSSFNQLMMAPLSMMLMSTYSERSSDGFKRATTIGGHPGFETWENESKDAEVTAVVANRFIVTGKGQNVESVDVVKALVQAVDLGKLAGLK